MPVGDWNTDWWNDYGPPPDPAIRQAGDRARNMTDRLQNDRLEANHRLGAWVQYTEDKFEEFSRNSETAESESEKQVCSTHMTTLDSHVQAQITAKQEYSDILHELSHSVKIAPSKLESLLQKYFHSSSYTLSQWQNPSDLLKEALVEQLSGTASAFSKDAEGLRKLRKRIKAHEEKRTVRDGWDLCDRTISQSH